MKNGFTLVEIVVVMGMVGILLSVVNQNLFRSLSNISLSVQSEGIVRDIREQQSKAMSGMTASGGAYVDYSIRFEPTRYILYPGTVYDTENADNVIVNLEPTFQFSTIDLPGAAISFSRIGGDVRNWNANANSLVLEDIQTFDQIGIEINPRGVVTLQSL